MTRRALAFSVALLWLMATGCFGSAPQMQYYQLVPESSAEPSHEARLAIAVEEFSADAAYDDERIVYRPSRHQLKYYYYHRWSSLPGTQVADFLREAYARSGRFLEVDRERTTETDLLVSGRVRAFEEVDVREDQWVGRVALEFEVRSAETGDLLFSQSFEELVPLTHQTPDGLARGLSTGLTRIAIATAGIIAKLRHAPGSSRSPGDAKVPCKCMTPR